MKPDPFESYTISLILAWVSAIPLLVAAVVYPFTVFSKEFRGYRLLLVWFALCLLVLSPARYLLFQITMASAYPFQSLSAFISTFILTIYVPIVFSFLVFLGVGLPALCAYLILRKIEKISFDRGILAAVVFPIGCLLSSYLFYLVLPGAAWTVRWINAEDLVRATNGPAAVVYRYVTMPFTPVTIPSIFEETPKTEKDLLRCHVATLYLSNRQFWRFVKQQYPEIYERKLKEGKAPNQPGGPTPSKRGAANL